MRVMEGHTDPVWTVDWDSACKTAVSGSWDTTIKQWDLGSGRCVETYQCGAVAAQVIMHESGSSFLSLDVMYTEDGDAIAEFKAWAMGCGTPLMRVPIGCFGDISMTANSDLSCVVVCAAVQDAFNVKVWK